MNIFIDIDDTICKMPQTAEDSTNYALAVPIQENINKANSLYHEGNVIVYWTARGTGTKIDWREVTEQQFERWGVHYHEIRSGKPAYDMMICDKAINVKTFEGDDW